MIGWLQRRKIFRMECVVDKFFMINVPVSVSE